MTEIIHLDQNGVRVSNRELVLPGGSLELARVRIAWVETRRPQYLAGALLALIGAAVLLRAGGPLRLLGLVAVAVGVLRARVTEHVLKLRLDDGKDRVALRTADGPWAHRVLAAIERARLVSPS